ncbi:hypothetical protein BV898_12656 [Hypsibius exemplaris]|uniref:C2H2-type domain-containing protein n=1 Tax=Hypsibius exemplaris TaxID=2072580 RepID=A0A1W0WD21_HYPEX|nr:hypothetical protein BV898_12656 [Hypsibius exemplaris]
MLQLDYSDLLKEGDLAWTFQLSGVMSASTASGAEVKKPIKCTFKGCRFATTTNQRLQSHRDRKHKDPEQGLFRCTEAGCSFPGTYTFSMWKRHQQVHKSKKPIPCLVDGCSYDTFRPDNLTAHVQRYHTPLDAAEFRCKEKRCKYLGGTKADLERHMFSHTRDWPLGCDYCTFRAYQVSKIKVHKQKMHPKEWAVEEAEAAVLKVRKPAGLVSLVSAAASVDSVSTSSSSWTALQEDLNNEITTAAVSYQCSDCECCYEKLKDLENHEQTHTEERGYECPTCGYFSKFGNVMMEHMKRKDHHKQMPMWGVKEGGEWPVDELSDILGDLGVLDEDVSEERDDEEEIEDLEVEISN